MSQSDEGCRQLALSFAQAIARREYTLAYTMVTPELRARHGLDELRDQADQMLDDLGSVQGIQIGETMTDWPDKGPEDQCWLYVSIDGAGWSEAVTVVVARRAGALVIVEFELGRP